MTGHVGLRILEEGKTGALRSQALWHGIASCMTANSEPVLSFCRPAEPYVGIGYFARLEEIDRQACRRHDLPIIRRRIGGGPVYLDSDQQFFQITLPASRAPARIDRLYDLLLEPAAEAFRELGLPVRRRGLNDLAIGDRKISGTGAGRIGDGVVVVGNLLMRFPYQRMAEILALPDEAMRGRYLSLMRRHVTSVEIEGLELPSYSDICKSLIRSYSRHLGSSPRRDGITDEESAAVLGWQNRFASAQWLAGVSASRRLGRQVKISSDVWLLTAGEADLEVEATVIGGRIESATVRSEGLNGAAEDLARAMKGQSAEASALEGSLRSFGSLGTSVVRLLMPGLNALA